MGIDESSVMLQHARDDAADKGLVNVYFEQAVAQVHHFRPQGFDVASAGSG